MHEFAFTHQSRARLTPGDLVNLIAPVLRDAGYDLLTFAEADMVVSLGTTVIHVNFEAFSPAPVCGGAPVPRDAAIVPPELVEDSSWEGDDGAPELDATPVLTEAQRSAIENDRTSVEGLIAFRRRAAVYELRKGQ